MDVLYVVLGGAEVNCAWEGESTCRIAAKDEAFDVVKCHVSEDGAPSSLEAFFSLLEEMQRVARSAVHVSGLATAARGSSAGSFIVEPWEVCLRHPTVEFVDASAESSQYGFVLGRGPSLAAEVASEFSDVSSLVEQYDKLGFVWLPGHFTGSSNLKVLQDCVAAWEKSESAIPYRYLDPAADGSGKMCLTRIERFFGLDATCDAAVHDPLIVNLLTGFLGGVPTMFKEKTNYKEANGGKPDLMHQDMAAGWGRYGCDFVTMVLFLDENTKENAAVSIKNNGDYPRSLMGPEFETLPHPEAPNMPETDDWSLLEGPPGSVAFFSAYVPHGSPPNFSKTGRRNLYITYNARTDGEFRVQYYKDKLANYPPNCMRDVSKDYHYKV